MAERGGSWTPLSQPNSKNGSNICYWMCHNGCYRALLTEGRVKSVLISGCR